MRRQIIEDAHVFVVGGLIAAVYACLEGGWSWLAGVAVFVGFVAVCYAVTHPMRRSLVEQRHYHEERMAAERRINHW